MEIKFYKESFKCKVSHHPVKGRTLIATEDIPAGNVILSETPLVAGPSDYKEKLCCLVCLKVASTSFRCPECSYPMCSETCQNEHTHFPECTILKASHVSSESSSDYHYSAILPLRCLLLKEKNPDLYEYLLTYEDHASEIRKSPRHDLVQDRVVKPVLDVWHLRARFSADEIERVEGIMYTNTVELPVDDPNMYSGRAFYPYTSFASHDCINNTFMTRSKQECGDGKEETLLETRAKMDIKCGTEISLHYSCGLKGRAVRRQTLAEGWYFSCQCQRCTSPTGLDSHLDTLIKCNGKCQTGDALVLPVIETDSTVTSYRCQVCGSMTKASDVLSMEGELTADIENCYTEDILALEAVETKWATTFHPRHSLLLIIKWLLVNLYGRKDGYFNQQLSEERLQQKVTFCQDYLSALDIVDPGISHNRGLSLWELYSVRVFMLQRDFASKTIGKDKFKAGLEEMKSILEEIRRCLYFYSDVNASMEAKIYQVSLKALATCKETLNFIDFM